MKCKAAVILMFLLFAGLAVAQDTGVPVVLGNGFLPEQGSAASGREDELYNDATDYLNDSEWQKAADKFSDVAALKGRRADAALYWKAYALNKAGQRQAATSTVAQLRTQYPKSTWLKDAGALEVEMRQAGGQPVNPSAQGDEDLKMLALNSLMNSDSERAIPLLQGVLSSPTSSPKLKERALFVLAQSDSAKAEPILASAAKGQSGPDLQVKAIRYLGISGTRHTDLLKEIYASSNDERVKKAVLQAYMTSGVKEPVLVAAKSEKDPSLRRSAIHQLGAMGAKEELRQMYQTSSSAEDQENVLQALGIAGDTQGIEQIANTATDPNVRKKAIRNLGIFGGQAARPKLVQIYSSTNDAQLKKTAAEALFVNDDAIDLVALARKEGDAQMKRYLVEKLSVMDNKEARDYMLEILNK